MYITLPIFHRVFVHTYCSWEWEKFVNLVNISLKLFVNYFFLESVLAIHAGRLPIFHPPNFSHIRYTCNNVNVIHTASAYVQLLGLCLGWQTNFCIIILLTIHLSLLSSRSKTLITVLFNSVSKFLELLSALS